MELQLRHNRFFQSKLGTTHSPTLLKKSLFNICQDDPKIANILMERSPYKKYGCRVIGLYRCVVYNMEKAGIPSFSAEENDRLIDKGGELDDCWSDNFDYPIFDILDAPWYVKRLNKTYDLKLEYFLYRRAELGKYLFFEKIRKHIENDTPVVIKMPGIFGGVHFLNVDGVLLHENGNGYFHMKETYRRYKGYNDRWCNANVPEYAEVISQ